MREQRKPAFVFAIALAGLRCFMLDFFDSRDPKRLDQTVGFWLRRVDSILATHKEDL
jgi:hypothetical protein